VTVQLRFARRDVAGANLRQRADIEHGNATVLFARAQRSLGGDLEAERLERADRQTNDRRIDRVGETSRQEALRDRKAEDRQA